MKYLYAPKAPAGGDFAGKKMAWLPVPGDDGFAKIEILAQEGDDCQINLVDTNEVSAGSNGVIGVAWEQWEQWEW